MESDAGAGSAVAAGDARAVWEGWRESDADRRRGAHYKVHAEAELQSDGQTEQLTGVWRLARGDARFSRPTVVYTVGRDRLAAYSCSSVTVPQYSVDSDCTLHCLLLLNSSSPVSSVRSTGR